MTTGTSPQGGIPFALRTVAAEHWARAERSWSASVAACEGSLAWLTRGAAALHVLSLVAIVAMAWHMPNAGDTGAIGGVPALHLAFLMATGVATALLTLGGSRHGVAAAAEKDSPAGAGVNQLLSQMSHELRTPLNAVIGFSEVMLRELHGPLGHARYQEYAAHISASGGQLLKASEDTLAVTATISALMANRLAARRERVVAATLVRDAWVTAAAGAAGRDIRLVVTNCTSCTIECERRGTGQALEHLLREAIANAPAEGAVHVKGRRRGGMRSIEIEVGGPVTPAERTPASPQSAAGSARRPLDLADGAGAADTAGGGSLRMILAGLLLEMQGARLHQSPSESRTWSACVTFPGKN
jgi:signal transduction histidine kinase